VDHFLGDIYHLVFLCLCLCRDHVLLRTIRLDAGTVGMKDYDDVEKEVVVGTLVSAVAAWHVAFVLFV